MFDCHSQHKTDSMEMVCWKRKEFVRAKWQNLARSFLAGI